MKDIRTRWYEQYRFYRLHHRAIPLAGFPAFNRQRPDMLAVRQRWFNQPGAHEPIRRGDIVRDTSRLFNSLPLN